MCGREEVVSDSNYDDDDDDCDNDCSEDDDYSDGRTHLLGLPRNWRVLSSCPRRCKNPSLAILLSGLGVMPHDPVGER